MSPQLRAFLSSALILLATSPGLIAQRQGTPATIELVVKLSFDDSASAEKVRIQLTNESGVVVSESFARGGEARFPFVEPGNYRLRAVGADVDDVSEHMVVITSRESRHMEFLRIRGKKTANAGSPQAAVSAATLSIPPKATTEFEKGVKALQKKDLDEAKARFNSAIDIYPRFAAALNNLGVISMQRGNLDEGGSFFARAIEADDSYAPSYLNLAKADIGRKQRAEALPLLTKADSLEPNNLEVLSLLVMLEFEGRQMDAAVGHVRRLHALPSHEKYAYSHFLAGKALEYQNHPQEALLEYQAFMKEAPQHPTIPKAKESIAGIEKRARQ